MQINKVTIRNFGIIQSAELSLGKLNLITGINYDSESAEGNYSGNGAGKSTIQNAIFFALYGNVTNLTLKELLRTDAKECSVTLECSLKGENLIIIRKIPSELQIFINDKEMKFNTQTIAQNWLDGQLEEDINKFRTFRMIDQNKGINLLDLGVLSLRKELMNMLNVQFIKHRVNLLNKKNEREILCVDRKLYKFYLSKKRESILAKGLELIKAEQKQTESDREIQRAAITKLDADIQSKKKLIYYKEQDLHKLNNGKCPILGNNCPTITNRLEETRVIKNKEIDTIVHEIETVSSQRVNEEDALKYYDTIIQDLRKKEDKTKQYLLKLKEAFKFADYKYTKADIQLYTDAIKTLDEFSAYYVMEWLGNLSIIINDLLKEIDIEIEFSADKQFISVKNGEQYINYAQLSGGQKTFLNVVFKLGILLNEGITSGLIMIDEGINAVDTINFRRLIDILKNLNFQSLIIYQNCDKTILDVSYINVERKNDIAIIS